MKSSDVIAVLKSNGWEEARVKGSHHQFKHPTNPGVVTVPHPKKDLGRGLVRNIERVSGLSIWR